MFETIKNAFGTKEIRVKIWATLLLLLVYRIGCFVPVPGLNVSVISQALEQSSAASFLNVISAITGGSLSQGTLFALGIIPFINSFIIMQLLTLIIPKLEEMSKDGEEGRKKITQITRYVAIVLGAIQAIGIAFMWKNYIDPIYGMQKNWLAMIYVIVILVGGSVMVMWLGERITEYGIGNGTSLIIFVGILSTAGTSLLNAFRTVPTDPNKLWNIFGFLILVVALFAFIVFMDGGERRITVQYAKQVKGNKMYGGQTTFIPIRVNASGVMPIIFASSFIMFPQMIISFIPKLAESKFGVWWMRNLTTSGGTWWGSLIYYIFLVVFIIFFAYFYSMIQFNPEDVSKNIQQYGGFIPGIRPGKPTSDYLKRINNRITLFGAIFLSIICVIPTFLFNVIGKDIGLSSAFSATGLLIVVSVALEFNKSLESQIMMRHYKGFLK
ncbi:MAG: preprotein translocase subunit SecY [Eubacteriales bacterium]|jgi:preprotein translocase subunit SecY|nr:preprotein translocase subunit SecY [Clostridium sp.]MCI6058367.1 preprotein translocase subunit SecY [Clostridiales bacterium]MDY2683288.1 preprotein translocase subunit SecY [Eubacteriales bacterium]MEE0399266.1 preprotein translocase subunit SecY [Christensenellales bacterium]MCI6183451.1 preprotein translocase subunit SecY [Clostridiales bacterium]